MKLPEGIQTPPPVVVSICSIVLTVYLGRQTVKRFAELI